MAVQLLVTSGADQLAKSLDDLRSVLGDPSEEKFSLKLVNNAHRVGGLLRGVQVSVKNAKQTLFPTGIFADGLFTTTANYIFSRGNAAGGSGGTALRTEKSVDVCLQDKVIEPLKKEILNGTIDFGSGVGTGMTIYRFNDRFWGMCLRTHNERATAEALSKLKGLNVDSLEAQQVLDKCQREAVGMNEKIATTISEWMGVSLTVETLFLENMYSSQHSALYVGCGMLSHQRSNSDVNSIRIPSLTGTATVPVTPGQPTVIPYLAVRGSLEKPDEADSLFVTQNADMYEIEPMQNLNLQCTQETNMLLVCGPASRWAFDYGWLRTLNPSSMIIPTYHGLAYKRAAVWQSNQIDIARPNRSGTVGPECGDKLVGNETSLSVNETIVECAKVLGSIEL